MGSFFLLSKKIKVIAPQSQSPETEICEEKKFGSFTFNSMDAQNDLTSFALKSHPPQAAVLFCQ
jgi:hypothetical protein